MSTAAPSVWVITERRDGDFAGRDGREIHGEAIACALGAEPVFFRATAGKWFGRPGFDRQPEPPWPDLVIAIGRLGLHCGRRVRAQSGGRSFLAVLQKPAWPLHGADFVWAPWHDRLGGRHAFSTLFSPHPFTAARLQAAAAALAPRLAALPRPHVGVLVGGPNTAYRFGETETERLCTALRGLCEGGAGLIVATSQRTGATLHERLRDCLDGLPALVWDRRDRDFYPGLLGSAEVFVATPDSVNMIGEAAGTGKGILVFPMRAASVRFRRFHEEIARRGIARPLGKRLEMWNYAPVNATEEIAAALRDAMSARRKAGA